MKNYPPEKVCVLISGTQGDAGDLLQIVRKVDDFPIVIETIRDFLNDALDFEHFKEVMGKIESGSISVHIVQTDFPSPFASSVLFDFVAVYCTMGQTENGRLEPYNLSTGNSLPKLSISTPLKQSSKRTQ